MTPNSIAAHLRPFLLGLSNRHFLALDLIVLCITPVLTLLIRLDEPAHLHRYEASLIIYTCIYIVVKPLLFWTTGLYSRYWPYASVDGLRTLAFAGLLTLFVEIALFYTLLYPMDLLPTRLPRSIPVSNAMFTMLFVGATRLAVRALFDRTEQKTVGIPLKPVLIAGAGVAGAMVVRELRMNQQVGLVPVAFLDDDPRKQRALIHGIRVEGRLTDLAQVVLKYGVQHVIIAMPTAPGKVVRGVVQACKEEGIVSQTVPGVFELLSGSAKVSELRDIQIEDLLRRGVVRTDPGVVSPLLHKRRVMVTGAGGSIGSELCRQISLCGPAELILLGHGENSIFKIANALKPRLPGSRVSAVIADIRDEQRMEMVFQAYRPEIVFHAAAHKHVGLMEANVPDAITNNVLGTRNVVEMAARYGVERFVMISSDKAVNPTSVMGVTKRIAELIVHDAAVTSGKPFVSVRFGNVLGSRGSVVPIFKAQIAAGGPLTVSDPEVTRFFMTIPEAVQLVLQAAAMGTGGEVFVLDMGDPIRIADLAREVIRLSGFTEGRDIDIVFTGLKPGEKLHEELFLTRERPVRSKHDKIFVCANGAPPALDSLLEGAGIEPSDRPLEREDGAELRRRVQELIEAVHQKNIEDVQELISRIVPEYQLNGLAARYLLGERTEALEEASRKQVPGMIPLRSGR